MAIILFIDEKYDPKNCPVEKFTPPNRLIRLYLADCLKTIGDRASPLTVLKPLVLSEKETLSEAVPQWKAEIDSLKLPESTHKTLIELLENAILSRFPTLTIKVIQKMIQLTPLEKTVAGQELIFMGIEKGELIGKIHTTQRFLKYPITSKKKLLEKSPRELRAILKQLEAELRIV